MTVGRGKLVYGWGINDVNYPVQRYQSINGGSRRFWICPYYQDWKNILERCFSSKLHQRRPTYIGCTIDFNWKHLSGFIKWVDSQPNKDWQNCEPDKDLLGGDNKHYGEGNVVYIPAYLNNFIVSGVSRRGNWMMGVTYKGNSKAPFQAQCANPFGQYKSDGRNLGYFKTELEAHKAWQAKKHGYACQLADLQEDPRVAQALRERYAPDKDWTKE
jgi:hypothetical protein